MGLLEGKVALVTGAARGQGRSHCVRCAEEGADIIAIDICEDLAEVPYPMASAADLAETAALVEALDRRIVTAKADVRSLEQMEAAVSRGLAEFGHIDIVAANAGVFNSSKMWEYTPEAWNTIMDVNLYGIFTTIRPVVPSMIEAKRGGSIVITSSLAGFKGLPNDGPYVASKFGVVGLTQTLAIELGEHSIRVNSVHPTNVNTKMIHNPSVYSLFRPDVAEAGREVSEDEFLEASRSMNLLPIPYVEPVDISNAVVWLSSDQARYITGVQLPVDAGAVIK